MQFRLDHVAQPVDVPEVGLGGVVDLPEGGREADAGAKLGRRGLAEEQASKVVVVFGSVMLSVGAVLSI
ncbi:MAG TPA: hypothetical protein VEA69_07820, partial [Tepidisphaeraceae bacterium]|nr:hypothetical protein [Tepidisphaeraceae bacterium]